MNPIKKRYAFAAMLLACSTWQVAQADPLAAKPASTCSQPRPPFHPHCPNNISPTLYNNTQLVLPYQVGTYLSNTVVPHNQAQLTFPAGQSPIITIGDSATGQYIVELSCSRHIDDSHNKCYYTCNVFPQQLNSQGFSCSFTNAQDANFSYFTCS